MKSYQTLCGAVFFIWIAVTGVSATSTVVPAQIPGYVMVYSENNILYLINLKLSQVFPFHLDTLATGASPSSEEEVFLPTSTVIAASTRVATPGEIVNFTATVTPVDSNPQIPTGNVMFIAQQGEFNTITLGTVPLDSEGQANI